MITEPIAIRSIRPLAWGSRVSLRFRTLTRVIAYNLTLPDDEGPDWLMACMAWESDETFSPSILNKAGSGAVGLIQFMPATARLLATSTELLSSMTAERQLLWVEKYFRAYKGRMRTFNDVYMAILWPRAIGMPDDYVLWHKATRPTTYRQNIGLDVNRDAAITKGEACSKVAAKLDKGRRPDIALA